MNAAVGWFAPSPIQLHLHPHVLARAGLHLCPPAPHMGTLPTPCRASPRVMGFQADVVWLQSRELGEVSSDAGEMRQSLGNRGCSVATV